jgi:nucleotide-binding universal stress UspA family protein
MKKILIATDGSGPSTEALEFGLDLAADEEATAIVVHVIPSLNTPPIGGFGISSGIAAHEVTDDERALLAEAAALAETRGVGVETELLRGPTAARIVAYADAKDVDLIVVGSRGRGALTTTLLGSVSLGVLRHTSRPVLIVRETARTPAKPPVGAAVA